MKAKFTYFGIATILLLAVGVACSQPVSIADQQATAEAEATVAYNDYEATQEARSSLLERIAPAGTVVDEAPPGAQHDTSMVYEFEALPPNGGVHHPTWQKCDVYDEPVKPEHAIHSMEHGGVWIAYQTDIGEDAVSDIEKFARRQPFVLISPYPNLRSPLVITAWGLQLEVDSPSDPRIQEFINAYAGGTQSPEPAATCTTGTTETVPLDE